MWKWLLFTLWIQINLMVLVQSWFRWKAMVVEVSNLAFAVPDSTFYALALIQIFCALLLGFLLTKWKHYGITTGLILAMILLIVTR